MPPIHSVMHTGPTRPGFTDLRVRLDWSVNCAPSHAETRVRVPQECRVLTILGAVTSYHLTLVLAPRRRDQRQSTDRRCEEMLTEEVQKRPAKPGSFLLAGLYASCSASLGLLLRPSSDPGLGPLLMSSRSSSFSSLSSSCLAASCYRTSRLTTRSMLPLEHLVCVGLLPAVRSHRGPSCVIRPKALTRSLASAHALAAQHDCPRRRRASDALPPE